jgi:hypothetical protein
VVANGRLGYWRTFTGGRRHLCGDRQLERWQSQRNRVTSTDVEPAMPCQLGAQSRTRTAIERRARRDRRKPAASRTGADLAAFDPTRNVVFRPTTTATSAWNVANLAR